MQPPRQTKSLRILALTSLLWLSACGQDLAPADYIAKASRHIDEKAFNEASIELNNALQQDPQNREARWMMAQISLHLGDGAKAERDARRAIELGTPRTEVLPVLARALLLQEDAARLLTETSLVPQDASPQLQSTLIALRGKALLLQGEAEKAQDQFEKAREIDVSNVDAAVGMAFIQASRGLLAEARTTMNEVLALHPKAADAWTLLGDIELQEGNFEAADKAYSEAISNRAYVTLDRAKRAHARVQLGKYAEADSDLGTLSRIAKHPYVAYVTGLSLFRQGRHSDAANAFETSFSENPAFIPNRVYLATTRLILGQPEQALRHAEFIRSNAPDSRGANLLFGAVQISRAEYATARDALERAIKTNPDDAVTVQMLAATAMLEGDASRALVHAERLAALRPNAPEAMNILMLAQLMAGATLPEMSAGGEDAYRTSLLLALQAFRDNKFDTARTLVAELRSTYPDQLDPLNLEAAIHLATGEWRKARDQFERILERQPDDAGARINLAKLELHDRNFERVKTLVTPIVRSSPGDEPATLLLVAAEHSLGNQTAANAALEQLLRENPTARLARALLARRLLVASQPDKVIELLRDLKTPELDAAPVFLQLRGSALIETGDIEGARATLAHWVRIAPDSAVARLMLAESLLRARQFKDAQAELNQAIKLNPQYLPARIGELRFLTQSAQFDKAREASRRLLGDFGEQPEVLAATGWHALMSGDFATAENHLGRALAANPDTETALLHARALWGQNKHAETFAQLNGWLETHPEDSAALLHLAGAHLNLGQDAEAVAAYQRVLKLHPEHVPTLNNIAWLSRQSNPDEALRLARRAHELAPLDPHVLDTLGMLYFERRDLTQANWFLTQALAQNPEDQQIRIHMARVQIAQGKTAEARAALQQVLEQSKGSPLEQEAQSVLSEIPPAR